jgi:type III secretory pathway component EscR
LTPLISKIADFTKENPGLVKAIFGSVVAFTGLLTVITTMVYIVPQVVVAMRVLALAVGSSLGPIGLAVAGVSLLAGHFISTRVSAGGASGAISQMDKATANMNKVLGSAGEQIEGVSGSFSKLKKEAEATAEKIQDVEKRITSLIKDNAEDQQTYKENLAQVFIDQEEKVAQLRDEIQKSSAESALGTLTTSQVEELAVLQARLFTEQEALSRMVVYREGIEAELVEMKRRSQLTEFELRLENLMRQRVADLNSFKEKLELHLAEREELKLHLEELGRQQESYTRKVQDEQSKQVSFVQAATSAINASMSSRVGNVGSTQAFGFSPSLPRFAEGGIVTGPTVGLIGEAGPEAIIPLSKAGGLGGVTVNIYGDVTGTEIIEKVKEGLMRGLRSDTKFSIT